MWRYEEETIHIHELRVECIVGVRPTEREHEQPLVISLSFPANFAAAQAFDALEHTVDYSAVARATREFLREGRFVLLETLARRLAEHLCERFALGRLSLHVRKPAAIHDSAGPGVSLTLVRDDGAGS